MTDVAGAMPPEGFFANLTKHAFSPGWAKREPAMWPVPRPTYKPTVWRYAEALTALTQATAFVSTEFAERRNLIMVNPIPGNAYPSCRHLVAAYQLVMPGETARSHRHSPNALRLILDATPGVYTLVDGAQVDMAPGDVLLTPQWQWHGHANYSDMPAFWIDILDVPLVQNLGNMFFEHHPDSLERVQRQDPNSSLRYPGQMLASRALEEDTLTFGDGQIPTMGLQSIGLREGHGQNHRGRIDNNIFAITSGEISFTVDSLGDVVLSRGDVIVVPSWFPFSFVGRSASATMVRVTDEPVFQALGFRNLLQEP